MPELSAAAVQEVLDTWPVAILGTINADGTPHQVPIVFARAADALWSSIDGKPKRSTELQRLRNVRRDPRVSLLLERYADAWPKLWWVRVDGHATILQERDFEQDDRPRAALSALRAKYPQYGYTALFSGPPTLLCITVKRIVSWCADPLCWSVHD